MTSDRTELNELRQFKAAVLAALGKPSDADLELERVNAELRACGIEYPLGARGVRDLRGFLNVLRQQLDAIGEAAELIGDKDDWPAQLRARLVGDRS